MEFLDYEESDAREDVKQLLRWTTISMLKLENPSSIEKSCLRSWGKKSSNIVNTVIIGFFGDLDYQKTFAGNSTKYSSTIFRFFFMTSMEEKICVVIRGIWVPKLMWTISESTFRKLLSIRFFRQEETLSFNLIILLIFEALDRSVCGTNRAASYGEKRAWKSWKVFYEGRFFHLGTLSFLMQRSWCKTSLQRRPFSIYKSMVELKPLVTELIEFEKR